MDPAADIVQSLGGGGNSTDTVTLANQIAANLVLTNDQAVQPVALQESLRLMADIEAMPSLAADSSLALRIADLESQLLESRIAIPPVVEQWTAPVLLNSWVNWLTTGGFAPCGFYKDPYGIVRLRGLVQNGTINAPMFNLPVGYRPAFVALNTTTSNSALGRVDIAVNGDVTPVIGNNTFVALDGITFRAA